MKHRLFIGLFLAMSLFPLLGILVFGVAQPAANETLATWPSVTKGDGSVNTAYLQELSDYLGDRFALRQELVNLQHSLSATLLGESGVDSVILGKEGWLFYAETLDDYQGVNLLSQREIWSAARSLYLMQEYCQGQGVSFLFTIAPNKNSLYGAYMPDRYTAATTAGNAQSLVAALEEMGGVAYADLFSVFLQQQEVLYRRLDSHWSQKGAALAGDTLLQALGRSSSFFSGDFAEVQQELGDLYEMVYPTGTELDTDLQYQGELAFSYVSAIRSTGDNLIRTTNPQGEGSLLMFRDSFGNALHSFLAESYATACFSRITPYDFSMIASQGADTVIIELVERNLDWLNTLAAIFPAPQRELDSSKATVLSGSLSVTAESGDSLEGYIRLSGNLSLAEPDTDSPIYLCLGDSVYEASPAGEGDNPFCAYISATQSLQQARLLCYVGGELVSFAMEIKGE